MKRQFGTLFSRWVRGGVELTPFEWQVLERLVSELPQHLRSIVERQFEEYELVQREIDGRALNFYPSSKRLKEARMGIWPLSAPRLQMNCDEAPLIRLTMSVDAPSDIHAVLHAVKGQVFCVSFNKDVRPFKSASGLNVVKTTHAWRSNFLSTEAQQAVAADRPMTNAGRTATLGSKQ